MGFKPTSFYLKTKFVAVSQIGKNKERKNVVNLRKNIFPSFLISGEGLLELGFAHISDSYREMKLL